MDHDLSSFLPLLYIVLKHGEGAFKIMMVDHPKNFPQIRKAIEDEPKCRLRCHEAMIYNKLTKLIYLFCYSLNIFLCNLEQFHKIIFFCEK
jgi:hypothetical protein